MGTQRKGYFTRAGLKVPSVTTVLSRFKDAGGLIHWAWDLGTKGINYREARDSAADAGTMAHEAVEQWIKGEAVTWPAPQVVATAEGGLQDTAETIQKAQKAFGAFLEWSAQTNLRVTHTEMPLVSEKYAFGGTFDALLVMNKRSMGDWKTSNRVYPEYLVQVAAYGKLWEENYPDEPIEGGFHLLRFDKTYGDFHAHWWGELESAWKAFLLLRELYELEKELKARAA